MSQGNHVAWAEALAGRKPVNSRMYWPYPIDTRERDVIRSDCVLTREKD